MLDARLDPLLLKVRMVAVLLEQRQLLLEVVVDAVAKDGFRTQPFTRAREPQRGRGRFARATFRRRNRTRRRPRPRRGGDGLLPSSSSCLFAGTDADAAASSSSPRLACFGSFCFIFF
ncbi:hypothetical protein QOT17_011922 [Balamuthia mandrillaris]